MKNIYRFCAECDSENGSSPVGIGTTDRPLWRKTQKLTENDCIFKICNETM